MLKKIFIRTILLIILFFTILSCTSQKPKETEKVTEKKNKIISIGCLNFIIPEAMEESQEDAKRYKYTKLLVDKDKKYYNSTKMIAIREKPNNFNDSLLNFTQNDQAYLQQHVLIIYEDKWEPKGFKNKNINYISYQFIYRYDSEMIYQRSVYLECPGYFYIISLSSKNKNNILEIENDFFWENINITP